MAEVPPDLERDIVDRFLINLEENSEITGDVFEVIDDFSDEEDFGGRDLLMERVLEVKRGDED